MPNINKQQIEPFTKYHNNEFTDVANSKWLFLGLART
jgi:hypothetical protein